MENEDDKPNHIQPATVYVFVKLRCGYCGLELYECPKCFQLCYQVGRHHCVCDEFEEFLGELFAHVNMVDNGYGLSKYLQDNCVHKLSDV